MRIQNNMKFCAALLVMAMVVGAASTADARAGSSKSSGSRGSRTYSAPPSSSSRYRAAPIQRSTTPQPSAQPQYTRPQPQSQPQSQPFYQPQQSFISPQRSGFSPFWSGLAGGALGYGLSSMIFGHSNNYNQMSMPNGSMNNGMDQLDPSSIQSHQNGSMMGGLMQLIILGGLGWFAWRFIRQRMPSFSGMGTMMGGNQNNAPFSNFQSSGSDFVPPLTSAALNDSTGTTGDPLHITESDKAQFSERLTQIQTAWSNGDLNRLRQYITPEMQHYFSEELSANSSRGLVNKIEHVALEQIEVLESWTEYELDYATAHLSWRALDYMTRIDREPSAPDYITEGNSTTTVAAEEIWTFMRAHGGNWLLSAIQQVG